MACRLCKRMQQCCVSAPNIAIGDCSVTTALSGRTLIHIHVIERDVVDHDHDHLLRAFTEGSDEWSR